MVSSIGGASTAQAIQPTRVNTEKETEQEARIDAPAPEVTQEAPAATQGAESAAAIRLGDRLGADLDTARVQRAVEESGAATSPVATEATEETEAAEVTAQAGAQPPAGGAAPSGGAGGAASSSSGSTDSDYIAEADTNADKTVSDEERAVYEAKLREQAQEKAVNTDQAMDQTESVRAAYGQADEPAPALDMTA